MNHLGARTTPDIPRYVLRSPNSRRVDFDALALGRVVSLCLANMRREFVNARGLAGRAPTCFHVLVAACVRRERDTHTYAHRKNPALCGYMKSAPCERPAPGEKIRRWVPEVPFWRPSKSIKTLRMFIHVRRISMISATYGMRVTFCISSIAIFISRAARIIDYCHDSYEGYTMSRQSFEIHRSAAAPLAQGNGGFLSLIFF